MAKVKRTRRALQGLPSVTGHFIFAVILAFIAIGSVIFALSNVPSQGSDAFPPPFSVIVDTEAGAPTPLARSVPPGPLAPITEIEVDVTRTSGRNPEYHVTVGVASPSASVSKDAIFFAIQIPTKAKVLDCRGQYCINGMVGQSTIVSGSTTAAQNVVSVAYHPQSWKREVGSNTWENQAKIAFTAPNFAYLQSGANLQAQLPEVAIPGALTQEGGPAASVQIVYKGVESASAYSWTGGEEPSDIGSSQVSWFEEMNPGSESTGAITAASLVSAVNRSTEDRATSGAFLAGIFFGVAGGAGVGCVQEVGGGVHSFFSDRRRQASEHRVKCRDLRITVVVTNRSRLPLARGCRRVSRDNPSGPGSRPS